MKMVIKDIEIYRGDDFLLEVALLDANGLPADLSTATIELAFGEIDGDISYADITVNQHVVTAVFSHAATKDIQWTTGEWDLQITQAGKVTTVARGRVKITRDVTP